MAAQKVTLYVRQRGTRKLTLAKTKNTYPLGTIYVLRYTRNGRRVWETLNNCTTRQDARVAGMKKETALLNTLIDKQEQSNLIAAEFAGYLKGILEKK